MRLIFLSGPSGGGKSTFLGLLRANTLPAGLRQAFDPEAHHWPVFDITNRMRDEITRDGPAAVWAALGQPAAAILHYDIVAVRRSQRAGFEADPAFRLLDGVQDVQFVFLRPPPDRLNRQFTDRNDERKAAKTQAASVLTRPLRSAADRVADLFGRTKGHAERSFYADAAAVEHLYDDWHRFAAACARNHGNRPLLTLAPADPDDDLPRFRLVSDGDTAA